MIKNYNKRNSPTAQKWLIAIKGLCASLMTLPVVKEDYKSATIILIVGFVVSELINVFSSDENEKTNS